MDLEGGRAALTFVQYVAERPKLIIPIAIVPLLSSIIAESVMRTLECVSVNLERLGVLKIDLWERGPIAMERLCSEFDLLTAASLSTVD